MAVDAVAGAPATPLGVEDLGARPTERLPIRQLVQLSVYWLGINSIMGGSGSRSWSRLARAAPSSR